MQSDTSGLRIALLSYRSKPHCGGQGIYVRHLSKALTLLGHQVDVLSGPPYPQLETVEGTRSPKLVELASLDLYREPDPFRIPNWREFHSNIDALEFAIMGTGGFPEPLTFSLRAARYLSQHRGEYDVLHDNQTLGYGSLLMLRDGWPLVTTVHHPITVDRRLEIAAAEGIRKNFGVRRWYGFTRMQGKVIRRLPTMLTVSENSLIDLAEEFGADKSRFKVVPVGVDSSVFYKADTPRVPGRIVCVTSSDSPMKGARVLIEAVAKLATERDVELVMVGKPKPDSIVMRTVDQMGVTDSVRFVSGLSDAALGDLLRSAEVAVVPSLYEGFSMPAIEAMACATPLIATRAGAIPEVVGDGAELVEPGNPSAMAAAIGALMDDPARLRGLSAAGLRRVEQCFTWEAVAKETVEIYRAEIERRRRNERPGVDG